MASSLRPSLESKINLLSIYDRQEQVNVFNTEVTKLSHHDGDGLSAESGSDEE